MKPLKFKALLKQTIWGGDKIIPFKHLDDHLENVGESWEISGVPGNETVVADGDYAGKKLNELVIEQKDKLVGKANYERFGDEFPLLIKFIDARQDLSIQVHPTDEIAKRQGKERGKTERPTDSRTRGNSARLGRGSIQLRQESGQRSSAAHSTCYTKLIKQSDHHSLPKLPVSSQRLCC